MYASPDTAVPFAAGLVMFCVFERVLSALTSLFLPGAPRQKQGASAQFLISLTNCAFTFLSGAAYSLASMGLSALKWLLWVTVLLMLGSVVYVLYEDFPWVWTDLARGYNAYLGPFMQGTVVVLAQVFNIVFKGLIPLWNGLIFFVNRLVSGFMLPTVFEELGLFISLGQSVLALAKNSVLALASFVSSVVVDCPPSSQDACYDVSLRTLDLLTPMANIRDGASVFVKMTRTVCGYADPIVDAVSYPLMDANLAGAVHNLGNAILYFFFQLSEVTYLRCLRHGSEAALMCTPDMEPVYTFLAAGLNSAGYLLDNWLDVIFVIVQNTLGFATISCSDQSTPSTLDIGPLRASLFPSDQTIIVGLTGYLMAITDGSVVAYEGQGSLRIASWPSKINITYGAAAVSYGLASDGDVSGLASGGTSTALMGCTCAQDPVLGMQVQCSVLPFNGLLETETGVVPVFFQQGSTVQRALTCSDVDITVQSVRWPATRFSGGTGNQDCATSKTCNQVDATVWLTPRAGACDALSSQCDCYPYCMAARLAGTTTAPLVLYSAEQWKGNVYLLGRDCNIHAVSSGFLGTVSGSLGTGGVVTIQPTSGGAQFVAGTLDTISCLDNLLTTSIIDRSLHPVYTTPTQAYLRNPDAPFAITGDTVLTQILHGDGSYTVKIERLTGAAGNEFTLSLVSSTFPANPPPNVPSALFSQYPKDSLTIPYARLGTLGVSSRDYVFFAVNPSVDVFRAYLDYCANRYKDALPQFGLIMVSSYSPIRIWRVDAYQRCTQSGCGPNLVAQADIPDAFSDGTFNSDSFASDCLQTYNDVITQLEYVNELNIAVTVRYTDVNQSFVQYRTYWLNIDTMQLSGPGLAQTGPWMDEAPTTASGSTVLCPAMQILPKFGSFIARLVSAGVFLIKMPLDSVLYTPGIINLWSQGLVCPLQTRGHTVLQQCGANAFALDDFFDSLQSATDIFWAGLTFVSRLVSTVQSTDFVQNALNGIARYGAGSIDLWTARFQVLKAMDAGPSTMFDAMPTSFLTGMQQGGQWAQGALKASSNMLGWARFGYTCVVKIVVAITRNVLLNTPVGASGAWRIIVNTLDEMRSAYDSYVVANMRQSCAGISLMFGLTNPWAVFLYQQCLASSTVVQSGLTLSLSIFNLAPFAQCMCHGTQGKTFAQYALQNCVPQASTALRPTLLQMIQASSSVSSNQAQALCTSMISLTKSELTGSFQPWFDAQYLSLNALAASVDYSLIWADPNAGECLDIGHDPNVVVLMPWPQDYFQGCSHTTLCRSRCSDLWDAFDQSYNASGGVSTTLAPVTVNAESLYFPTLTAEAFTPMRIMALIQPGDDVCLGVCGRAGDLCTAVAGVKNAVATVQYYCIPSMMSASVYRTQDATLEWQAQGSEDWTDLATQMNFADRDGRFLIALTSAGQLYMASGSATVQLANLTTQTLDVGKPVLYLSSIFPVFNPPYSCINLNLIYRLADGKITGQPMHRKIVIDTGRFPSSLGEWYTLGSTDFFSQMQGLMPAVISAPVFAPALQYVLFPATDNTPMALFTVQWDSNDATNGVLGATTQVLSTPLGMEALLGGGQTLSQSASQDSEGAYLALVAALPFQSTGWLSELRVSGVSAGTYSSRSVPVTVQISQTCGVSSCINCPDGEVQSLCDALQECVVVNCIGTPVNMKRTLCQVGQTVADHSRESLALLEGAWGVFVDMYLILMNLSLQSGLTGIAIEWPDDNFFGYVCTLKDNNAHMISILTSALNSVIQMGHSAQVYLQGGAGDIDPNFNSLTTIQMTALTGFVNQMFMGPMYALIVSQKILMCRVNGLLAIFDATGFTVRVGMADLSQASSGLVGQCLTQNSVVQSSNPADSSSAGATAGIVSQVATSASMAIIQGISPQGQTLETVLHLIDAKISFLMGVVYGMADLLQSMDLSHCKMPDSLLNQTVFCACGDTPFKIPDQRRGEGLVQMGLWCTGTLSMLDSANTQFVIYNPFTYSQLQEMGNGTDAYLACMSGSSYVFGDSSNDCSSLLPTHPLLQAQGVSVLSVLTTCKANYMRKQWDQSAYVLFNSSLFSEVVSNAAYPAIPSSPSIIANIGLCLADSATRAGCLQAYLTFLGQDPVTYWGYVEAPTGESQLIDACQVFTGPATSLSITAPQRSIFRACLDSFPDSNCQLSSSLWTPQSTNAVPVAKMHGVVLSAGAGVDQIVQLKYSEAYTMVMDALAPLKDYNNKDVMTVFFSPEGDIMHQMLDCVFQGPYNSVDYWPVDSERILTIPQWFRDATGSSRSVDVVQCVQASADNSPPYSCGSPSRQAVIKYFFRDFLQQQKNAVLKSIVGSLVNALNSAWNSTANYGCLCKDGRSQASSCCGMNSSTWIPSVLNTEYQTIPENAILRALTYQVEDFYRYSLENTSVWTKYLDSATLAGYDWTKPIPSAVATKEALFRTDKPALKYDATEVNSPMLTTALWDQCHGLLSQVFFTIPMQGTSGGQWTPRGFQADQMPPGTEGLRTLVREAVNSAYATSPLYRHYNVSHIPSDSRMCRPMTAARLVNAQEGYVNVSPYSSNNMVLLDTSAWPSLPSYGTDAFPIHGCFCGWQGDGLTCTPPALACPVLGDLCPSFPGQSASALSKIKSLWNPSWPCPALALGDHSGALDASEYDDWLQGVKRNYTISGDSLLRRGRAGLRAGSWQKVQPQPSPADRVLEPSDTALPYCASSFATLANTPLLDPSMLSAFISNLFPVGQGVYESGTSAYCLRYLVEAALLEAMTLVVQWEPNYQYRLSQQAKTEALWRSRCDSQISLLALCKNLDAYQPPVDPMKRFYPCPFSVSARSTNDVYMTPGCLVHSEGYFYDPCNCAEFACDPSRPVFTSFSPACRLPFDPRDLAIDAPLGSWSIITRPSLLSPNAAKSLLDNGASLGNVPRTGKWATDEGFMNTTGLHCDMLTDWWPDGQTLPVGYHATVPCASNETGYRTFDTAFAVQRAPGQFTVVKMVYQHDATRSAGAVDTESGAGGVCRASNLGMPTYQTNVMQICTRQLLGADTLDVAIPGLATSVFPDSLFGPEKCSTSSVDTPWFDTQGRQDSALHSVGTVPNFPLPGDTTYPPSGDFFGVGPKEQILSDLASGGTGWGGGCSDFAIKECVTTSDCPSGYICLGTVCISDDFANGQHCHRHDMCPLDHMCDGTGVCSQGYIVYLNNLNSPIEAPVFSEQCDDTASVTYYTDGSSPWEYVPDWLEGHGMCSNKNWYLYELNLKQTGSCSSSCPINAHTTQLALNSSLWWPTASPQPQLFPVLPTICDRDYEHMSGPNNIPMKGCSPKSTGVPDNYVTDSYDVRYPLEYSALFRNYNGQQTQFAKVPGAVLEKTGFLGVSEAALWNGVTTTYLQNCESVQNCYPFTFTFNGIPQAKRWYTSGKSLIGYNNADIFRCGVAAYFDSSTNKCKLDTKVLPLYAALCQPSPPDVCTCINFNGDAVGCVATVDANKVKGICAQINQEYSASYTAIKTNTKSLQALFNVFIPSDGSLTAQVSGVECFNAIYSSMSAWGPYGQGPPAGVYFPWDFALYEVPMAWVYQCTYLSNIGILPQDSGISCTEFERWKTLDQASAFKDIDFAEVQGGYTREAVLQGLQQYQDYIHSALPSAGSLPEAQAQCSDKQISPAQCSMTPYCPERLDWKPHSDMDSKLMEFLAGGYNPKTCASLSMAYILGQVGQVNFQTYVASNTLPKNYQPEQDMPWINKQLPDIDGIINQAIDSCITVSYNTSSRWPLFFNFSLEGGCLDFKRVLSNIQGTIESGDTVDSLYSPSTNTAGGVIYTKYSSPTACIFNDLADQSKFYNPYSDQPSCLFSTKSCGVDCVKYPLTYQSGGLPCAYPLNHTYSSADDLIYYIWDKLGPVFQKNLRSLTPFTQLPPSSLSFFNDSQKFFPEWAYSALEVQRYMSNINPDTTKDVMCTVTDPSNAVNFTVCNDANYAALKSFTETLRQNGAPVVPKGTQLRWQVGRSFLAKGALFAFANHTREDSQVLLSSLFNAETRCGVGEQMFNRVCLFNPVTLSVRPWVPWMSGEWNPYEFCDVQLQDLSQGNQEMIWPYDTTNCPNCANADGEYRNNYMFDPLNPSCDARKQTYAKQVDVDPKAPTNLCYVRMVNEDNVCQHAQGMVGGERGQTMLNHPSVPHLYGTTNLSVPPGSAGLFPRAPSSLLNGMDAPSGQYGFLSIPGDELGITTLGLSVDKVNVAYLRVARLPLKADKGFLSNMNSPDVAGGWVKGLADAFQSEDAQHLFEQSSRGNTAWDCPMRRAGFYSRSVGQPFVPVLPSPGRARRIFSQLTQNLSTHPTVSAERDGSRLGAYLTSNGFCFCPDGLASSQGQCLIPLSDTTHNCSLNRTIYGLQGGWVQSFVFQPTLAGGVDSTCRMQFDWPYVGGTLRDGTTYEGTYTQASDLLNRRCHVLDRLKPFLYRYSPSGAQTKTQSTTLDPGGVCHTGRAAQVSQAQQAKLNPKLSTTRCVKQSETDYTILLTCEDGTNLTLTKETSTPLDAMVTGVQTARASCSQCSAPPIFTSPNGSTIQPESSFGIPFRFSAERAIAYDLQTLLGDQLGEYNISLNPSTWKTGSFLTALLNSPSSLFQNIPSPTPNPNTATPDPAWDSDWVFCNTTDALKAANCAGRIQESDWRADRFQSCYKTINTLTRDSPGVMSSVDVCLTDSRLSALCTAVKQAQALVSEANCLASGSTECMLKPYLYTPGIWDASNKEFVHQTVQRFYSRVTPYACPEVDQIVKDSNQAVLNRCAATPVSAMYLALQACRDVVNTLAQVLFYLFNILLDCIQMIAGGNNDRLKLQIAFNWNAMTGQVSQVIPVISDLLFDALFRLGSTGQKLYNMLQSTCGFVNTAYHYWLEVWCKIAIDYAPMVILALRELSEFSQTAFQVLNDALGVIFRFLVPDALSAMEALGYTKNFRDRQVETQARERQQVHDSLVESKKEGKSEDAAEAVALGALVGASAAGSAGVAGSVIAGAAVTGLTILSEGNPIVGIAVDAAQSFFQEQEMSRLLDLLPGNWTLFDFSSINVALDAFELYVTSDQQCLNYRAGGPDNLLTCSFPPLATADQLNGANLVATRCWADAQQSIGTSNLLACTDSDTCYKSLYDTTQVVCVSCPEPWSSHSLYGCSPITSMCTCGVPTSTPDSCTSNEECYYSSTTCLLITGLDSMSYGNQPCAQCSKQVQCIVRDSSGVGKCGCVFQPQPVQQCSQPPGDSVDITDPTKMCGYLPTADRTQPLTLAHWDALALAPCIYLNPSYVYCAQVYQPTGASPMAVGLIMAHLTQSFSSRRLLSEGRLLHHEGFELHSPESEYALPDTKAMHSLLMEDWNNTAAPCSGLAWAYQQEERLGPIDTMYLHRCAYWRQVGRETIKLFNLTALHKLDGFLLSVDDFASALSQKSVLVSLVKTPEALVFAAGRAPILKPVHAALLAIRALGVSLSMGRNASIHSIHTLFGQAWKNVSTNIHRRETAKKIKESLEEPVCTNCTGRKLMSTNIVLAQNWVTGSYSWPPVYYQQLQATRCALGTALVQIMHDILQVLIAFYTNAFTPPPPPPKTLWGNLPNITTSPAQPSPTQPTSSSWEGGIYNTFRSWVGLDAQTTRGFFATTKGETNVFTLSTSMLRCDFASVTFCTEHRKDLFLSIILMVLLYIILTFIGNLLGLPVLGMLFILFFIPILIWYVYGTALTCQPMIPTCLMDDVVGILNSTFPLQVDAPHYLKISDGCLDSSATTCFKSCGDKPMLFVDWRDTFAYGLCSISVDWCRSLASTIGDRDPLSSSLLQKANIISIGDELLAPSMDFCFWVTLARLIPVFILGTLALSVSAYVIYLPFLLLPHLITVAAQALAYTHS